MVGCIDYEITHGNSTLFALDTDVNGRSYVYTVNQLESGKGYLLIVRSRIKKNKNEIEEKLRDIYGGDDNTVYKFNIKSL